MTIKIHSFLITALLSSGLFLCGCVPTSNRSDELSPWIKSHRLGNGDVIVTAPANYCVDRSARPTGNFVLMVNCDVLTAVARTAPRSRGVLTVSTSARLGDSEQGVDLVASLGDGSIQSSRVPGLVLRRMNDQPQTRLPGAAADHWRGLMRLNNRIVSFAAYGPEGGAILGASGQRLLENLAKETLASSQPNPS